MDEICSKTRSNISGTTPFAPITEEASVPFSVYLWIGSGSTSPPRFLLAGAECPSAILRSGPETST